MFDIVTMEEWREIPAFTRYSASSNGRIRRNMFTQTQSNGVTRRYPEMIMKLHTNPEGYLTCGFVDDMGHRTNQFVARLIAFAFIPNPDNFPEIDHIDRNPSNNAVSNLRWVSRSENNHNRKAFSNTGEKFICKEVIERYIVSVPNTRQKKYFSTLQDAVRFRDAVSQSNEHNTDI
jgi:hypothetical protein